jgi:hypothetical protein
MSDSCSNILFWGETKSRENSDLDDIYSCLPDDFLNLEPEELWLSSSKSENKFLTEFDFFGDMDEPETDIAPLPVPAEDPVDVEFSTTDPGDEPTPPVSFESIAEAVFL